MDVELMAHYIEIADSVTAMDQRRVLRPSGGHRMEACRAKDDEIT
jgi:hypothetical protein